MSAKSWLSGPSRKAAVLRHLPAVLVAVDRDATILWASDAVQSLFGYAPGELVGRHGLDLIDPVDAETAAGALLRTFDRPGPKEPWPLRIVRRDGSSTWVEMTPTNLLDDPGIRAVLISIRPLDQRTATEEEARTIEELFRRAFDDAPIGMALVRLDGRFARVNDALCHILRRPPLDIVGVSWRRLTHPDDIEADAKLIDALLTGEQRSLELDKRFLLPNGSHVWVCTGMSLVRSPAGEPERFVLHVQDITHRKASEVSLSRRATRDQLTGLPNRALVEDRLELALQRGSRLPTAVGLITFETAGIDDALGELLLVEVAGKLRAAARPGDTVGRDGTTFVVVCEDLVTDDDLEAIATRMARAVGRPLPRRTALSSGLESASELLGRAGRP